MRIIKLLITGYLFIMSAAGGRVQAQGCTTLGQTPATAFPVCGSAVFTQSSVPACVNGKVTAPCSSSTGNVYEDLNPYWYKFTCFTGGTLQLTITPKDNGDDYDWQLFDVTGHSPADVYGSSKLLVACNWSGLTGTTGTSATASSLTECGSTNTSNPPKYSKEPTLVQGHDYLLLISHFSGDSQSGYDLSFAGGTASITDTVVPAIKSIAPVCDGSRMLIVLNKKMKCSSLYADGSDFTLGGTAVKPVAAKGNGCSTGFDLDSIELTMSGPISPGNYTLLTQNGGDGNTLFDNCGTLLAQNISIPFHLAIPTPIEPDSLTPPGCAPQVLQLVFKKQIECNSIAPDGSDFTVTGSSPVTVSGASASCDEYGESYIVKVQLAAPIVTAGSYVLHLRNGVDGNTLVDECGLLVLSGPGLPFTTKDTVYAGAYTSVLKLGCVEDTISLSYPNIDGVNLWTWIDGNGDTSHLQSPDYRYTVFGTKAFQLMVSNGVCSDTTSMSFSLDNAINAAFEGPDILCPQDAAAFKNNSTGNLNSWIWDFGDGAGDNAENPANHLFPFTGVETKYRVSLIVGNNIGCKDTAYQQTDVLRSCYIAVPSAFTPNGDGMNDYLYPLNAYKADNLEFRVFNRYGQLVFASKDWLQKWDGTLNGRPQPPGSYVWSLQYTDRDTGKKEFKKGVSVLIR